MFLILFLFILPLLIPNYYSTTKSTTTTYDTLTIKLTGNGTILLHFLNGTKEKLTSSTTLKVLNTTYIWITSTTPFMVDRNTMITNYFGENITTNTILNVTFNPPIQQGYVNITMIILNQGVLNMKIYNDTTYLTLVQINHTESFLMPKGYFIDFHSDKKFFLIIKNGKSLYALNKEYNLYYQTQYLQNYNYQIVEEDNMTIFIIFVAPIQNTIMIPNNTKASSVMIPVELGTFQYTTAINALAVLLIIILIAFLIHITIKQFEK